MSMQGTSCNFFTPKSLFCHHFFLPQERNVSNPWEAVTALRLSFNCKEAMCESEIVIWQLWTLKGFLCSASPPLLLPLLRSLFSVWENLAKGPTKKAALAFAWVVWLLPTTKNKMYSTVPPFSFPPLQYLTRLSEKLLGADNLESFHSRNPNTQKVPSRHAIINRGIRVCQWRLWNGQHLACSFLLPPRSLVSLWCTLVT